MFIAFHEGREVEVIETKIHSARLGRTYSLIRYTDTGEQVEVHTPSLQGIGRVGSRVDHTRTSTDVGPDFCAECSKAAGEWVQWPCGYMIIDPSPFEGSQVASRSGE